MIRDTYSILAEIGDSPCSRFLKTDNLFCVLADSGNIAGPGHAGLYYKDTRFVSSYDLKVNGKPPTLLKASIADDNTALRVQLSFDLLAPSGSTSGIVIHRTIYLSKTALRERIDIESGSAETINVLLEHTVDADFSDIFEVRQNATRDRSDAMSSERSSRSLSFHYAGRDAIQRRTRVEFDPAPQSTSLTGAKHLLSIPPGESTTLYVNIGCEIDEVRASAPAFSTGLDDLQRERRCMRENAIRVSTGNDQFNAWLTRSLADIDMLTTATATGPYPFAGLPWFSAPFGRDGIITALQTLWMDPSIARGVLKYLAKTQAKNLSPEHDAEPGKILHEARMGEMANTGEVPFSRNYGSVDSTPLFVILAGEYFQRTRDQECVADIWPCIERALRWIDQYGDADGDGFVEYQRMTDRGLNNQGWKDSVDSVFHADGSLADGPIALCEVQGYVFSAKCHAARMAKSLGHDKTASKLSADAQSLQARFEDKYWSEDLGTYVLALDRDKRQCAVRSSNAGHLLYAGIARPKRAKAVADMLCGRSFFSGWGIRTVANSEARFDPLSYHNGSVWPHDTSFIAVGLARYGFTEKVDAIFQGMLDASSFFESYRLPELFSGQRREAAGVGPVRFPHACAPQAWSAGAPIALLGAMLGIDYDAHQQRITFRQTRLPPFLDSVRLRGLRLGTATADVTLHRKGDAVEIVIDNKQGEVELATLDSCGEQVSVLS